MKKIFRMVSVAVCGAMLVASCTDTWDDHYGDQYAATQMGTGGTTMAFLQTNASDFADIIKAVGYDTKLNSSQVLTILAPQNGSFDKNDLLQKIADGKKKEVIEHFIENHILLYNISINNDPRRTFNLLNDKKIHFGTLANKTIEDIDVLQENVICSNGIVHVLKDEIVYQPSVMEQIADNYQKYLDDNGLEDSKDIISLYSFLKLYDDDKLDEKRSVEFGQDEFGNMVYSDSVMIRFNEVLNDLDAYLYTEDSLYWAIDPGVEAYQKLYEESKEYFKFNDAFASVEERRDSMQKYYAQYNIVRELFFNANTNKGDAEAKTTKGDSLVTTSFRRSDWKHHNYKAPFTSGILSNVAEQQKCSNGYVFTLPEAEEESETSSMPITVYDAFFHEIKIEADNNTLVPMVGRETVTDEWSNTNYSNQLFVPTSNDSISNGYYMIRAKSRALKPLLSFKLSNTLSGTYDIYICVLPWNVYEPDTDPSKLVPVKFKSFLYEANSANDIPYLNTDENVDNFTSGKDGRPDFIICENPTKVDTVYVGTHTFNYCYQYTGATSSYLKLSLERSSKESTNNTFDNKYLLDFIYLVPHRDDVDPKERFKRTEEEPDDPSDDPIIHH